MIFILGSYRRTKADTGKIIARLETILTQHPGEEDLANGEVWTQRSHRTALQALFTDY